jgi:hypothetical protein
LRSVWTPDWTPSVRRRSDLGSRRHSAGLARGQVRARGARRARLGGELDCPPEVVLIGLGPDEVAFIGAGA